MFTGREQELVGQGIWIQYSVSEQRDRWLCWGEQKVMDGEGNLEQRRQLTPAGKFTVVAEGISQGLGRTAPLLFRQ